MNKKYLITLMLLISNEVFAQNIDLSCIGTGLYFKNDGYQQKSINGVGEAQIVLLDLTNKNLTFDGNKYPFQSISEEKIIAKSMPSNAEFILNRYTGVLTFSYDQKRFDDTLDRARWTYVCTKTQRRF